MNHRLLSQWGRNFLPQITFLPRLTVLEKRGISGVVFNFYIIKSNLYIIKYLMLLIILLVFLFFTLHLLFNLNGGRSVPLLKKEYLNSSPSSIHVLWFNQLISEDCLSQTLCFFPTKILIEEKKPYLLRRWICCYMFHVPHTERQLSSRS